MKSSLVIPIIVAIALTSGTFFIVTKSVNSSSESQVVSYLMEKEAREKAEMKKVVEADEIASRQFNDGWRQLDERMKNPNWYDDSLKEAKEKNNGG